MQIGIKRTKVFILGRGHAQSVQGLCSTCARALHKCLNIVLLPKVEWLFSMKDKMYTRILFI